MKAKSNIYYAKLMLFGEYSIIHNSMALTIPYNHFNGELSFMLRDNYTDFDFARQSNLQLYELLGYIRKLSKQNKLLSKFNVDAFASDLSKGMFFESGIPQGYGVGSSGALIAALYDKYVANEMVHEIESHPEKWDGLKKELAQLESFYHGTSSGIDPLNSILNKPLLFKENGQIQPVNIHLATKNPDFTIFLVDTGKIGKTSPLVNIYMEKTQKYNENGIQVDKLNEITNHSIQSIISGSNGNFFDNLKQLSAYQFHHFKPMIPEGFEKIWNVGLENDTFNLKLCGSGGGGFLLGFTTQFFEVRKYFKKRDVEVIPVYVKQMSANE